MMRLFAGLTVITLGAALLGAQATAAQDAAGYPDRPVRVVVPFPSAGAMDSIARILGEKISAAWGQQIVVDNRPGSGGNIGSGVVAKAEPDGYTLLMVSIGHAVNPSLYAKMPFDPVKDFAPVTLVAAVPNLLVVHPSVPAGSVQELIALAKEQPGTISYASAGYGTSIHLAGEQFKSMASVDLLHIPYKGSGPAVTDLIGGHVQVMFDSITSALPHVRAGNLKALGVTSAKRSSTLPEVPTIAEAGVPGYEIDPWFGVLAPAGTPPAIVAKVQTEIARTLELPDVKEKLAGIGAEPIGSTPEAFSRHLVAETIKWDALVKEAGIRLE
jgi:tripartite-type tricarboxylate transporter receptor subunit TctC